MLESYVPLVGVPEVSVVMPVCNALPHLDKAVESILHQSLENFEFVILDDASTDGSTERLRAWARKDSRIRLMEVTENLGPVLSSDRVARAARAPIAARMDGDDISHPDRLRQQLEVLCRHSEVGLVASLCDIVDSQGRKIRGPEFWRLERNSWLAPFAHGAMMYRQSVFDLVGGYRLGCELWEDQDLVTRISAVSKVMVIAHSLYHVRQWSNSTRSTSGQQRFERSLDKMYASLDRLQQGESYDDLLHTYPSAGEKLDQRVFISMGSVTLWAGGRPRLFRRLLKRSRLSIDFRSLNAIVWTAWASMSPGTLRLFLLMLLTARNFFSIARVRGRSPVIWSQPAFRSSADHTDVVK